MEQRYSDNLKEIETAKKDYDDVKKFCEVTVFLAQLYIIIAYFLNLCLQCFDAVGLAAGRASGL